MSERTHKLPAIPPQDYTGSISCWMITLQELGYWNGEGFHGDIYLTIPQYNEILLACEGPDDLLAEK